MNYQLPKANTIFTLTLSTLCFIVTINVGILDNKSLDALVLLWVPFLIGLLTIGVYYLID